MTAGANQYYTGESAAQLRVALSEDIPALFQGGGNSASPTAKVGTAVVNGAATTYMRSDAAPPIDQAITPIWTSRHVFSGAGGSLGAAPLGVICGSAAFAASYSDGTNTVGFIGFSGGTHALQVGCAGVFGVQLIAGNAVAVDIPSTGTAKFIGNIAWNGATPPAQVTGFGTPTSPSVVANFSGTAATTAQIQATIAQILTIMKAHGMIGT